MMDYDGSDRGSIKAGRRTTNHRQNKETNLHVDPIVAVRMRISLLILPHGSKYVNVSSARADNGLKWRVSRRYISATRREAPRFILLSFFLSAL